MARLIICIFCFAFFDSTREQFLRVPTEGNFSETASSRYFIDKTMFIKYFMTQTETDHLVVLAPRRFGKSTNLSMLQHFLELQADRNGTALPPNTTQHFHLFDNLNIRRCDQAFFTRHFAQHPIIYLNLKHLVCHSNYLLFGQSFRSMIVRMLLKHRYLLRSRNLNLKAPREFFTSIQILLHPSFDPEKVIPMGRRMTRFLATHFERKCIILIDGFDAPGTSTLKPGGFFPGMFGFSTDKKILDIIGKFLSAMLEGNDQFVSHSLSTGVTRVGSTVVYANLTSVSAFEKPEIAQFFGLTEPEVRNVAMKHGQLDQVERLSSWYGGYHVENSLQRLFNTHSIVSFLETGNKDLSWEAPPVMEQLSGLFDYDFFGAFLEKSLETNLPIALNKKYLRVNSIRFRGLLANDYKPKVGDSDLLVQFLLENGYFTATNVTSGVITSVAIPNLGMKEALQELIYKERFFKKKFDIDGGVVKNYAGALANLTKNECTFRSLLNCTSQIFQRALPGSEAQFQAPLFLFPTFVDAAFRKVTTEYLMDGSRRNVVLERRDDVRMVLGVRFERSSALDALRHVLAGSYNQLRKNSGPAENISHALSGLEALKKRAMDYKRSEGTSSVPATIFIGLHVNKNRDFSLSYLCDSLSIAEAKTLKL